jgi:hypothetical protein
MASQMPTVGMKLRARHDRDDHSHKHCIEQPGVGLQGHDGDAQRGNTDQEA